MSTRFRCVPKDRKYEVTPSPNLGQFQFTSKGLFGVAPSATLRQLYVAPKTNLKPTRNKLDLFRISSQTPWFTLVGWMEVLNPNLPCCFEASLVVMVPHHGGLDAKSISFKLVHLEGHVALLMNLNPFFYIKAHLVLNNLFSSHINTT